MLNTPVGIIYKGINIYQDGGKYLLFFQLYVKKIK